MKITINIITYHNNYGLSNDVKILQESIQRLFSKKYTLHFNFVDFYKYFCPKADLNIFLEIVNQLMIKHATHNVLIPNQEWFYKHWKPYLVDFDAILSKTHYTTSIFNSLLKPHQSIHEISWTSIDRFKPTIRRDYNCFLHLCGKSIYKNTQAVIDLWYPTYPKLIVVYSPQDTKVVPKNQANIKYITQRLPEEKLVELLNHCPVHICCSSAEGFGHYLNEAKSVGALVVTLDAPPMNELITADFGFLVRKKTKKSLEKTLGSRCSIDGEHFTAVINTVIQLTKTSTGQLDCQTRGKLARHSFLQNKKNFRLNLETFLSPLFRGVTHSPQVSKPENSAVGAVSPEKYPMLSDDELPSITIVTPTYNRLRLFQMAIYNFKNLDYPLEKVEWLIIDDSDSDQQVQDILPNDERINYISLPKKITLGAKRNLCVEKARHPYIVFMDDDDYYYPDSARRRISYLIGSKKECVYCTSIACFHINKYISMINVPPHQLPFEERISEASLTFTKTFWTQQQFLSDSKGGEAKEFLKGRFQESQEISWEQIFVALLHSKNTSHKELSTEEPNGCHYGFSDDLFLFMTNLDN